MDYPKQGKLDIKSPIFTPRPGWGGKLKQWLSKNFESRVLPLISSAVLATGLYLVFIG